MSFFSTAETAFGLDISDTSLRLVQCAASGKRVKIQSFNETKLPTGCLINGEIKQASIFGDAVKKLMKTKMGFASLSREAVIALPETETFLKSLEITSESKNNLNEKIAEILPQNLPIDLSELYCDSQLIKSNGDKFQVLVGASPKKIVDDYLSVFKAINISPVVFEIEAAAISRLLIDQNNDLEPQIIIDIGENRTGLFLFDNEIKFTVSLPISGRQIDEIIMSSLELTQDQAEKAKIACGLDSQKCQGAILELLTPTIDELAKQIANAIDFYSSNYTEPQKIKKIVLCGGGANMKNIADIVQAATKLTTVISQPFKAIRNPDPHFFTQTKSQSFITAIGLALRGIHAETFYDHS